MRATVKSRRRARHPDFLRRFRVGWSEGGGVGVVDIVSGNHASERWTRLLDSNPDSGGSACVPLRRCRRNKAKPRRIQPHRSAVAGGDVGGLAGGDARIAAWNVYPPAEAVRRWVCRGLSGPHCWVRLEAVGRECLRCGTLVAPDRTRRDYSVPCFSIVIVRSAPVRTTCRLPSGQRISSSIAPS